MMGDMAELAREQEEMIRWEDTDDTWTTQHGETIDICDMSDRHLSNTIRMLERNGHTEYYKYNALIKERDRRKGPNQ